MQKELPDVFVDSPSIEIELINIEVASFYRELWTEDIVLGETDLPKKIRRDVRQYVYRITTVLPQRPTTEERTLSIANIPGRDKALEVPIKLVTRSLVDSVPARMFVGVFDGRAQRALTISSTTEDLLEVDSVRVSPEPLMSLLRIQQDTEHTARLIFQTHVKSGPLQRIEGLIRISFKGNLSEYPLNVPFSGIQAPN